MIRSTALLIAVLSIGGVNRLYAQETSPGPGTVEVTIIPGGATYFSGGDHGASFGNYTLGGALTYNINRIVGVEGEVSGSFSGLDSLQFGDLNSNQKAPSTLAYSGNVVLSLPTHSVTGSIRHRWHRRPHDVQGGQRRRQQYRHVSHRERWRRREMVRTQRPMGAAR
jgi:hypothetical protein